jgi:hypothetical protein
LFLTVKHIFADEQEAATVVKDKEQSINDW